MWPFGSIKSETFPEIGKLEDAADQLEQRTRELAMLQAKKTALQETLERELIALVQPRGKT